jgi:hypothetical protein
MMNNFLLRLALAGSFVAGVFALTAPSDPRWGRRDPQQPRSAQQETEQQQGDIQTQDAQRFHGTITMEKGKLILRDTAAKVSYQLDDQERAKQFEGKAVKVTGKLDLNTNLIHVENIELLES